MNDARTQKVLIVSDGKPEHEKQAFSLCTGLGYGWELQRVGYACGLQRALASVLNTFGIRWAGAFRRSGAVVKPGAVSAVICTGMAAFYPGKVIAGRLRVPVIATLFPQGGAVEAEPVETRLPPEETQTPQEVAAETFGGLNPKAQRKLINVLTQDQAAELLDSLDPEDRADFLEELPLGTALQLMSLMSPEEQHEAQTMLAFPEDSVGRMMSMNFVAIRPEWTIAESLEHLRATGADIETMTVLYIVDESGRLIDDVRVKRFLVEPPETRIRDLMDGNYAWLSPTDRRGEALSIFQKSEQDALPVVDEAKRIIGIVTAEDFLDVAEEEATEDIQKLGGSEALDEPYPLISLPRMVRKRAGWLMILFFGEILTIRAMGWFQYELEKLLALSLFVPLVISAGGNSGSQAATLVIRSLALEEFSLSEWWRIMRRELFTGFALGSILGVFGFLLVMITSACGYDYAIASPFLLAVTIGIALVGIVMWGTLTGSMLPLILKKIGFDPAASSAPFVATLVDVTGLIIYFMVAMVVMRDLLNAA